MLNEQPRTVNTPTAQRVAVRVPCRRAAHRGHGRRETRASGRAGEVRATPKTPSGRGGRRLRRRSCLQRRLETCARDDVTQATCACTHARTHVRTPWRARRAARPLRGGTSGAFAVSTPGCRAARRDAGHGDTSLKRSAGPSGSPSASKEKALTTSEADKSATAAQQAPGKRVRLGSGQRGPGPRVPGWPAGRCIQHEAPHPAGGAASTRGRRIYPRALVTEDSDPALRRQRVPLPSGWRRLHCCAGRSLPPDRCDSKHLISAPRFRSESLAEHKS